MRRLYTFSMHGISLLCSLFAILFITANPLQSQAQCQSWVPVGAGGFSAGTMYNCSIAMASDGTPYVLYNDMAHDGKATVKKYSGGTWSTVGIEAFSNGDISLVHIDISSSGVPYVYFFESSTNTSRLMRFNGSAWIDITPGAIPYGYFKLSPDGTPYMTSFNGYLSVVKYNGSAWDTVGNSNFSLGSGTTGVIAFDAGGTPYVAFENDLAGGINEVLVYKLDGTDWAMVGSSPAYAGTLTYYDPSFTISSTGIPYVGYMEQDDYSYHVRKFDGSSWVETGSAIPSYLFPVTMAPDDAGNVYMSYSDLTGSFYVARYNGSGSIITSNGGVVNDAYLSGNPSVAVYDNIPYVAYSDDAAKASVRKMLELSTTNSSASATICSGNTIALSNATAGGYWSSTNNTIATVGSANGTVSGVAGGVAYISYNYGACSAATAVSVNPFAGYITGFKELNAGTTTSLGATVPGGAWTSSNTTVATVNSGGIVSGLTSGTTIISYTTSGSCGSATATSVITVNSATAPTCVTWEKVGDPAATSLVGPLNWADYKSPVTIGTAPDGTLYTAMNDLNNGNQVTVKKYDGTNWVVVGAAGFTTGSPNEICLSFDGAGAPYVAYKDFANSYAIHVMKFDGSAWVPVGDPNSIYGGGQFLSMAVTGAGNIVVQYEPTSVVGTKVLWFDGVNWTSIGTVDYGTATNIALGKAEAIYSASSAEPLDNDLKISKFDGIHWTNIASHSAPPYSLSYHLSIDKDDVFYVTLATYDSDPYILVLKYDGTTWSTVGDTVRTRINEASVSKAADGSLYMYYVEGDTSRLVVRKLSGGSWVVMGQKVDVFGSVGAFALSADGTPLLAAQQLRLTVAPPGDYEGIIWVSSPGLFDNTLSGPSILCNESYVRFENASLGTDWTPVPWADTVAQTIDNAGDYWFYSPGVTTISYTVGGCTATKTVTVSTDVPPSINGMLQLCAGSSDTLTSPVNGGSWYSDNTSVATVEITTGKVTTASAGTATISYIVSGTGCGTGAATAIMTVNGTPAAGSITGTLSVCAGNNTALANAATGGVWSSSNTGVATINGFAGIVSGVAAGTSTITYSVNNACGSANTTAVVTVNAATSAGTVTGTMTVCPGANTTLSDAIAGGTWSSSNTAVATVNALTGVVSGTTAGNTTITYTVNGACGTATTTAVVTVDAATTTGAITGTKTVCTGANTTLGNAVTGGTWSSSNTAIATVNTSTGVVSGASAGNTTITYTVNGACGSATTTTVVTVNAAPNAGAITGSTTVTAGSSITLNDAVSGGTWSASNGNATVTNGVVTGVTAGTTTISYTVSGTCGSNVTTTIVTVNAAAPSGITGTLTVCGGSTTTLSSTPGGVWSSMNNAIASVGSATGIVSGVAPGVITIKYTLAGTVTSVNVTVAAQPNGISGASYLCQGATITLSSTATGATWSSSNTAVATIGSTGVVIGIAAGTTTISLTGANGCARTAAITVNRRPDITGIAALCAGTTTTLSTSMTGGAWGGGSAVATVSNGVVTAYSAGTTYISYTANGCANAVAVTVNAAPAAITGTMKVCPAVTSTLADATTGGTWSSNSTGIATVDAGGAVTAAAAGTATITYTAANSCYKTAVFTVNPSPAAIGGTTSACAGSATTLSNTSVAYSWTSGNTSIATVSSTGVVTGVSAGTVTIVFMANGTWCTTSTVVTINPAPAAIAGASSVCIGTTATLSNTVSGGVWTSSNPAAVTVDVNGVVTGVSTGSTTITYNVGGCYKTKAVSTSTNTNSIQGNPTICTGTTATLTSWGTGTWSSSNPSVATIASPASGYVTGMSAGNATITFFPATSCYITYPVTVVAAPGAITGTTSICSGDISSLSIGSTGGTWSSSNTGTATIGSATGVVTGVGSAGTVTIAYVISNSCWASTTLTVKPIPAAITGTYSVCATATTTLVDVTAGGVWSSSNTSVATVGTGLTWGHGAVSGIMAGTTTISFTVPATGCARSIVVTVDPCSRPIGNETVPTTFQLYPNPTTGAFTVFTDNTGTLQVITLDGRGVMTQPIAKGINTLALPRELAAGIYMCRYSAADGNTVIVRLVLE